jgi:ABC-type cobalamin/Fe3+-siderophores transport system ATPase subunit
MYIQKIEIKNLWGNDFPWTLNEDINVLIGKNGSGKSTILRMLNEAISPIEDNKLNFRLFDPIDEIIIELTNDIVVRVNSESRSITGNVETTDYQLNTTLINTFDVVEKSLNPNTTLLDYQLDKLKLEFVTYQRDLSNQVEEAFKNDDKVSRNNSHEKIQAIYETKNLCLEVLSELFRHTNKKFDEKAFHFLKTGIQTPILPENLSSGEKQILIILLTTLLQYRKEYILLMDEPEISLHIDWQRTLIKNIRQINPNCQIIIATHSPTVYYQGWTEKVTRIEEIKSTSKESAILQQKTTPGRVQRIKDDFKQFQGSILAKLYQFNRKINAYTSFTKDECIELLYFLKTNRTYPDVITFTTLISKLNSYKDAKEIFDLMKVETYTQLSHVKPNEITLNTLIKKVSRVEEGIELIQDVSNNEKLQLYPDIITFSTLLGKVKNTDEMRSIEEVRNYYGVKTNDIYLNKLNFKR